MDAYLLHMQSDAGGQRTPAWDKYLSEYQKNQAFILKQNRLTREETEQEATRRKKHPDK